MSFFINGTHQDETYKLESMKVRTNITPFLLGERVYFQEEKDN